MKPDDIKIVMDELCKAGADAVSRYIKVSGECIDDMPEYFMPAYVLDYLGCGITMTLETSFRKLLQWNAEIKGGRQSEASDEEVKALVRAANFGKPKVDMIIYKDPHLPKSKQDILALVEFKRGWIGTERDRVMTLLKHINTCRFGILCGWVAQNHRQECHDKCTPPDYWCDRQFELDGVPYFFCAWLLEGAR